MNVHEAFSEILMGVILSVKIILSQSELSVQKQ